MGSVTMVSGSVISMYRLWWGLGVGWYWWDGFSYHGRWFYISMYRCMTGGVGEGQDGSLKHL